MKRIMVQLWEWMRWNKLFWFGAMAGSLSGYLYWKYIGCLTGNCAITSSPIRSTFYFALLGGLLFSLFKKKVTITDVK